MQFAAVVTCDTLLLTNLLTYSLTYLLTWQEDDDEVLSAWQATSLVPPPPEAPALISALGHGRTANQAAVSRARAARSAPASPAAPTLRDPGAARHEAVASVELTAVAVTVAAPEAAVQGAQDGIELS